VYDEAGFGLVESVVEGYNGKYDEDDSSSLIDLSKQKVDIRLKA